MTAISINQIIEENFIQHNKKLDWIHLDVEGLDVKLLLSLNKNYIPKFIIFEDYNLTESDKDNISNWILENNFIKISDAGICMITNVN